MSATPPCRVCGSAERVGCYPDDHSKTICPTCCETAEHDDGETGHQFSYTPSEGHTCDYCGVDRNDTNYEPQTHFYDED